jgi:hypothetical protein
MNHPPAANQTAAPVTPAPVNQLLIIATAATMGLNFALALVYSRVERGEWSFAIGSAVGGALMFPIVFMLLLQIPRKFRNDQYRYTALLVLSAIGIFGNFSKLKRLIQTGSAYPGAANDKSRPLIKIDPKTFADAGLVFTPLASPAWSSEPIPNTNSQILISRRFSSADDTRIIAVVLIRNPDPSINLANSYPGFKRGLLKPGVEQKSESSVRLGDTQATLITAIASVPDGKTNLDAYYAINEQFVYAITLSRLNGEVAADAELRAFASSIRINRLP